MAVLQHAPGQKLNVVVFNKVLFYFDLIALRDLGETVTKGAFIALKNGPVVAKYDTRLLRTLADEQLAQWTTEGYAKPVVVQNELRSFAALSRDQLALVPEVMTSVSKLSSTEASDFSHLNPGWRLAFRRGAQAGRPPQPINMLIALQQLADQDPWLDEPLDEQTKLAAERSRTASRAF